MKKTFKALKLSSVLLLIMLSFIACDKDFNTIESDVIGKENSNFLTKNSLISILAYNKKLDSLQINNLSSNLFGFFNDPVYGQTTTSIISQVTPTSFNPNFGNNPVIDSVILRIPYFNKITGTDTDGNATYSINDSLYGNAPIKLSIYQNNYFLRNFNPNSESEESQRYYSYGNNPNNTIDNFGITENGAINFDDFKGTLVYENAQFSPSGNAIVLKKTENDTETTERLTPSFRVHLDNAFWTSLIIAKEGDPVLSNANNFNNYFRGLYLKAQAINGDGNMILLNLNSSDANISIYYSKDSTSDSSVRTQATYTLNFSGNRLNTFINNYNMVTLENGDKTVGDEKLYLKGGEGSMAIVDLFGNEDLDDNGVIDGLEDFKNEFLDADGNPIKLINEAHLIIYEDETMVTPSEDYHKYDRIYAYDVKNNTPLIDYFLDPSENSTTPFNSKFIHLGQRQTDENGVSKYKIRLTQHLNNILLKDSTNTKLGLVLSSNVNYINSSQILNSNDAVTAIPSAALLTTRGTIIHGNHENVPENKRMRLEIFFTEPK